jgi:plasmid stabilization system protein ParE
MATRRRPVVWSLSAQRGLEDVLAYVASNSLHGAQVIVQRALEAADSLTTLSERGRVVPEIQDPTIRETFVYS